MCLALPLTYSAAAPNPDYINALWIAESNGVLKLATASGATLFEINNARTIRAVAVDERRGTLWAYGGGVLRAYAFNGVARLTINVPAHDEETAEHDDETEDDVHHLALSVDAADGGVWLGVAKTLYHYSAAGKHLRTLNALTGAVRYQFAYDTNGLLITITDGDKTIIERDGAENPTAIVAPDGQRTTLTLDANGYLASVTNPAGESTKMTYTADGLLTGFTDGNGHTSVMAYDELGRLIKDTNAANGSWTLTRTDFERGHNVSMTSREGRTTLYHLENLSTGDQKRINTAPDGTKTETLKKTDGATITTSTDGTVTTEVQGPDPRFGMQAPITQRLTVKTPGGLTSTLTTQRSATLTDSANPLSLTTLTDTVTINGRSVVSTLNAGQPSPPSNPSTTSTTRAAASPASSKAAAPPAAALP